MDNCKSAFWQAMKHSETEERFDTLFYRPMGYVWALLFRRLGVTPNQVTWLSIFIGIAAGVCFYFDNMSITLLGIFLLIWANTYDSADGQLARMTQHFSKVGRLIDGFAGDAWFFTIYLAIVLRMTPEWGVWAWGLGAAAGYCHPKQAAMAEYYRHLHICLRKGNIRGFDLYDDELRYYQTLSFGVRSQFWEKAHIFFYLPYLKGQERLDGYRAKRLVARFRSCDMSAMSPNVERYCDESARLVWLCNALSFNLRSWSLFVGLLLGMPWLFFVFNLTVMNGLLLYLIYRYHRLLDRYISLTDGL